MIGFSAVSLVILAYLLGSIPSAVWIGKSFYGIDVRDFGSGNAGATNTLRVLGRKAALPVLFVDVLKGFAAVKLVWLSGGYLPETRQFVHLSLILGTAALTGHIFPVFAGFRGGKGVATLFGVIMAIHPGAGLICTAAFVLTLFITQYVSLSSMMAALVFPISMMFIYNETISGLNLFGLFVSAVVLFTHQKNIERLLRGEERKTAFLR
ncbi:MAG: glycerol-3-phosphate 1-O-acyltransferase PlsY [Sphingobacteriales bacterium]|jgi:glycerol-3-phosphate acyltransferase PlsY|nr:glycerol-3-phosphate 1-O-acyltransferase PlsY [Sphingobacteriales bacterium]